jgi:Gluconate 2-dehydrogenase subunit 3
VSREKASLWWREAFDWRLNRRQALELLAAVGAAVTAGRLVRIGTAVALPAPVGASGGFLTTEELAMLDAASAVILPGVDENDPGAREIGVVGYVQSLLSYFPGSDANCDRRVGAADVTAIIAQARGAAPRCPDAGDVDGDGSVDERDIAAATGAVFGARPVFAGGPFSGRNPQPHFPIGNTACQECHGANNSDSAAGGAGSALIDAYPPDFFVEHMPLNRLQRLSWKVQLLGADAVPEVADNPLARSATNADLRARYRSGLAELEDGSQAKYQMSFVELTTAQQSEILASASASFVDLLHHHVIEGTLCAPEYGGNRNRLGWQLTGFGGDSQPLGYEIPDTSVPGNYRERPEAPNSTPNPDEDCAGFSAAMQQFLRLISTVTGGGEFDAPYCYGVGE